MDNAAVRGGAVSDASKIVTAFTAQQVIRLTGLTTAQLAYWDKSGFFAPQYGLGDRRSPYSRIYSFKDVVGLRTLRDLRGKHGVPLPHLRSVASKLASYSSSPWADIKLWVWNRKVLFNEPETEQDREVVTSQYVLFPLSDVEREVESLVAAMHERSESDIGKTERHRYIARNALVIAGTRIRVETIRSYIEAGYSVDQILKEYPSLQKRDVEAVAASGATLAVA